MQALDHKALVIGIDGGTFDIIRPLIRQGELPNLAALMTAGVSADLSSTIPPITAPAWVSFMTGKNPGQHGIFHFVGHIHRAYTGNILTATDIKAKTLWSLLSEHGQRLILVNSPFTYPPMEINGIMVCGFGTPSEDRPFTYPEGIYGELLQRIGDYKIDYNDYWGKLSANAQNPSPRFFDELIDSLNYITAKRTEAVLYLMKEYPWDLSMVVYVLPDRLQHLFWRFMDPTHPDHDPEFAERYGQVIFDGYRKVDEAIGKVMSAIEDETTVIVLSDHGFGPLHKYFFVNKWLMQKGWLRLRRTLPWRFQITHPPVDRILRKLRLGFLTKLLPATVCRLNVPRVKRVAKSWEELIDWSRTKAYADQLLLGININLQGREPTGIVRPGEEFEALLRDLTGALYELRDPETGELVIDTVVRKEEVYTGPYVEESTDLLCAMKGLSYLPYAGNPTAQGLFGPPPHRGSGTHRFEGILIIKGPKVRKTAPLRQPRIIDVAPTILYLLDLPVPRDMEGRILEEAIHPDVLSTCPVTYTEVEQHDAVQEQRALLSAEDEEQVRKRLIDLGYIS
jgi:predicted AlkP superfamily phosphohydrolase/phosphomutase